MFLKLMGAARVYLRDGRRRPVYQPLYRVAAQIVLEGEKGKRLSLTQTTNYPWDGDIQLAIDPDQPATFDVRFRVPAWCRGDAINGGLYTLPKTGPDAIRISINGQPVASPTIVRGYAVLRRWWCAGDKVRIHMAMPAQVVRPTTASKAIAVVSPSCAGPLCIASSLMTIKAVCETYGSRSTHRRLPTGARSSRRREGPPPRPGDCCLEMARRSRPKSWRFPTTRTPIAARLR